MSLKEDTWFPLPPFEKLPTTKGLVASKGKRLLRGCTGGLLGTGHRRRTAGSPLTPKEERIRFAHRSVPDFLARQDVQDEMAEHLKGFKTLDAISQMLLADVCMF